MTRSFLCMTNRYETNPSIYDDYDRENMTLLVSDNCVPLFWILLFNTEDSKFSDDNMSLITLYDNAMKRFEERKYFLYPLFVGNEEKIMTYINAFSAYLNQNSNRFSYITIEMDEIKSLGNPNLFEDKIIELISHIENNEFDKIMGYDITLDKKPFTIDGLNEEVPDNKIYNDFLKKAVGYNYILKSDFVLYKEEEVKLKKKQSTLFMKIKIVLILLIIFIVLSILKII